MHFPPARLCFSFALLAWAILPRAAYAQRFFRQQGLVDPPSQEVTAEFLVSESGGIEPRRGTAWKVHVARGLHKGLYITGAWFKRDLTEDWIKILNDARIAELFVPYHQSSFIRYYDLTSFSFPLAEVRAEDAGPFGTLLPPFRDDPYPTVVKEIARPGHRLERLRPRRAPRPRAGDLGRARSRQLYVSHVLLVS